MKLVLSALVAIATFASSVGFAQDGVQAQPTYGHHHHGGHGDGGFIPGLIIGGLIGATIANSGQDDRPRGYVCYSENRRGEIFRARSRSRDWASEKALDRCYEFSRSCRPAGCEAFW